MASFPALPRYLYAGHAVQRQPNFIRTDFEHGPARYRRRFTAKRYDIDVAWLFTTAQYTTFNTFYETTINDGADWFDMTLNLGTGDATHSVHFVEAPQVAPAGKDLWSVRARLERRP